MPGKEQTQWKVHGEPRGLSNTLSNDLLVLVKSKQDQYSLNIYRPSDVCKVQSIPLPRDVTEVCHAVQSLNDTFVISYKTRNSPGKHLISELSINGRNFSRTFDPQSFDTIPLTSWFPVRLSTDQCGQIFIADWTGYRIFLLNSELTDLHSILSHEEHQLVGPHCLCFVKETR